MKYIMLEVDMGGAKRKMPIIFPKEIVHSEMAAVMFRVFDRHGWPEPVVVNAGEINADYLETYGHSETLKKIADPKDAKVIQLHDVCHGIIL